MSPDDFNSMADGLVEETLVETATTFFGARKALEEDIEAYHRSAEELQELERKVLGRAAALHALLPGPDAVKGFYAALGVEPGHLLDADELEPPRRAGVAVPRAWTAAGRYVKLVAAAYAALVEEAEVYMHGHHAPDEEGRMRLSVNYTYLQERCDTLNKSIEALNRNHSPSGTLCFVKGLDPAAIEKGRLSEATLEGYSQELDKELEFKPVECVAVSYLAVPELPEPKQAVTALAKYAKGVYREHPKEADAAVDDWRADAAASD